MNAESIVVGCLFLYFLVSIGCGGLFKCHTGFIPVGKLQVGQSHMQVSVLRKRVVIGSHFTQNDRNLRIDSRLIIGHSQHIERISSSGGFHIVFQVSVESFCGFVVFAGMIVGRTLYAVHLSRIFLVGIGREIVLRDYFRFVIILFNQIYFRYVIGDECLVFRIVLQTEKTAESVFIPLL